MARAVERKMKRKTILVAPDPWHASLSSSVRRHRLPLVVRRGGMGDVRVIAGGARRAASTRNILRAGGWIRCPVALALAERAGIPARKVALLLDLLDIRVKACDLGCF